MELDRTAFYPTGGGQPFDTGSIAGWQVVDVQEAGEGRIAHLLRARLEEAPPPGTEVEGILDWDRRFDHMQQHTGQHILSRAFERAANAATRSFHLGERVCTIDLDLPVPSDEIVRRAEAMSNETIARNVAVTVTERPAGEAARFSTEAGGLRDLALKPGDPVRLIAVGTFDETPCGGTHVASSGQVGSVLVRSWERFKGGTRVTFVCGRRVVAEAVRLGATVDRCAAHLSAPPAELDDAVTRLQDQLAAARRANKKLAERLAGLEGEALEREARDACGWRVIVAMLCQREAEELQRLAQACVVSPGRIALLGASTPEGAAVLVFARSAEGPGGAPRMGDLLAEVCAAHGGRGGGGAALARGGGMPADAATKALEAAFGRLAGQPGS